MHANKKDLGVTDDGGDELGQLGSEGGPRGGVKNQHGKWHADPPAPVGWCEQQPSAVASHCDKMWDEPS